jgi:flagellar biosynthetic protein FliP
VTRVRRRSGLGEAVNTRIGGVGPNGAAELRDMFQHGRSCRIIAAILTLAAARGAHAQSAPTSPIALPETANASQIDNSLSFPDVSRVLPAATTRQGMSTTLKIFVIMTVLTLAPAILAMTTCFPRIMIVLALLRQAVGTQQLPPGQILVGLSLFLTFLIMAPTYSKIYSEAVVPWLDNQPGMTQRQALDIADRHMRDFMFTQIERVKNEEDIYLFLEYSQKESIPLDRQITREQVPTYVLIPAFILSELKTAFVMGFRVYLPFLVIDMVVATVLISMGMLMLPPVMVSLPFKLLLFVLADGWHLVVVSLLTSFS